jgi:uncharacterized membrane protein YjfL (UPF0719 family)
MIILSELILVIFFLFGGKWLQDVITTFDDDHELFTNDNPCLGIAKAGYYLAIAISCKALFLGQGSGDWTGVRDFAIYGILSLLLLNIATITADRFILRSVKIYDEICTKRNEAVAWTLLGCYVGSAFILQGAMSGDDMPLAQSLVEVCCYFAIGQLALTGGALAYFKLHPDQNNAFALNNTSAGLSFAGYLIALGYGIGGLSHGNLHLNLTDISLFAGASVACIVVILAARRYLFRFLFANGTSLNREITEDQNSAAGWIMGLGSIGFSQLALTAFLAYTN